MLPAVALVLLALAGCTLAEPGAAAPTKTAQPYAIDQGEVAKTLGEVPEGEPMTPERTADFITRFQDCRWELVTRSYPEAVRPAVTVADTTGAGARACMSDGLISEENAMSDYVCLAQNPPVPPAALTDAQAGYLYDYWTGFVLPCYHENGYEVEAQPPIRADFVARWPFQNWSPRPSTLGGEDIIELFAELDQFCPDTPDGLS
ncbi:hypothetical protein [Conyzicola sp.]|uniref:hypothetical protein n=1 Tax=Conyzicola sp. TaxID=1969404 RepID=UPI003988CC5B